MPLLNRFEERGSIIGVWKIDEDEQILIGMLSGESYDEGRLASFSNAVRRQEYLAVRVLVKSLLNYLPKIEYNADGKPYFKDSDLNLSISHTKGFAAVIISGNKMTGIDIERRTERTYKVKDKFMSKFEIDNIDPANPSSYTCICWSAKETMFKALGCNEVDFCGMFHLSPFLIGNYGKIDASETRSGNNYSFEVYYQLNDDFVLTYMSF